MSLRDEGECPAGLPELPRAGAWARSFPAAGLGPFRCRPVLEGTLRVMPRLAGVHRSRGGYVIRGRRDDAAARQ